ncbi:MAG: ABC transporter substrate-binding protein, partial [bacterium]
MRQILLRMFIFSLIALVGASPVFAGGGTETAPEESTAALEGEPPRYASLVESGDLPSVSDRIGSDPLVVTPVEEIGQYGGIVESPVVGNPRVPWTLIMGEGLLRWDTSLSELTPNVATGWEMSSDGREFTF